MKKHFIAVLLAILMCLAAFAGCSGLKSLERYVTLVLKVDGEIYATYEISIFNNAVVMEPQAPEGMKLYGWTPDENWAEQELEDIVVTQNSTFITYNDVKDYIEGENMSVTLYAVFAVIPPKDLVVAWYRAEGVSTETGLNQAYMDSFTENMYAYLESKDYHPEEMDIVVRPYDGNVGNSCGGVMADGDVDIMVGWAANIGSTGGITFIENNGGITIGSVERYAARLTTTYLSRLVYVWILNTYGNYNLPEPDPNEEEVLPEPEPEPEPSELPAYKVDASETFSINIAWYAKSATSGIDAIVMEGIVTALKADLEKMGFNLANVTITNKGYDGNVGPSCEAVMADGNVDLMLGWGNNIGTTGGMAGKFLQNVGGVKFGDVAGRYVALLTDSDFVKIVFAWVQNTYGTAVDYPACFGWEPSKPEPEPEPDPEPEPSDKVKLVVGWYAKTATSGLTEEIMANFEKALKAYLTQQGQDLEKINLILRAYDGNAAQIGELINGDGDVDVLIGIGNNIDSETGSNVTVVEKKGNIPMGDQSSRYVALRVESELGRLVYDWIITEEGYASLATPSVTEPDPTEKVTLVIGWWSYSTSGLTEEIIATFRTALEEYLVSQGYDLNNVELTFRAYAQSKAADLGAAINEDNDVDIVIGVGNNIDSASGANVKIVEKVNNLTMGSATGRVIALVAESTLGRLVYTWATTDGLAALA